MYDAKPRKVEEEKKELLEFELMQTSNNLAVAKSKIAKMQMEKADVVKNLMKWKLLTQINFLPLKIQDCIRR